jgi:hypothetical protein
VAKELDHHLRNTNVTTPQRTDRIALGRNMVMSLVTKMPNVKDIDYLLMLDMDEVNYHLMHVVAECLNLPPDFGVCCANQFTVYYDLWGELLLCVVVCCRLHSALCYITL